jgi:hypothetical protein
VVVLNKWMQSIAQGSPFQPSLTWNDTTRNIMFEVQVKVCFGARLVWLGLKPWVSIGNTGGQWSLPSFWCNRKYDDQQACSGES